MPPYSCPQTTRGPWLLDWESFLLNFWTKYFFLLSIHYQISDSQPRVHRPHRSPQGGDNRGPQDLKIYNTVYGRGSTESAVFAVGFMADLDYNVCLVCCVNFFYFLLCERSIIRRGRDGVSRGIRLWHIFMRIICMQYIFS